MTRNFVTYSIAKGIEQYIPENNAKLMLAKGFIKAGKKADIYKFTPKFEEHIEEVLTKLEEASGLTREHHETFIQNAIANNFVSGFRAVNLNAKKIFLGGGIGKPLSTKGKSSEGGKGDKTYDPTAGYIPYDQSLSKLEKSKVASYQAKVQANLDKEEAIKIQLVTNENDNVQKWYFIANENGTKTFIYEKFNSRDQFQGFFYRDIVADKEKPFEDKTIDLKQPLEVIGQKINGKEKYYTADADPLVNGFKIDLDKSKIDFHNLEDKHYVKQQNISPESPRFKRSSVLKTKGFATNLQDALAISNEIETGGATSHSADTSNPESFPADMLKDLAQGDVFYLPNGMVEIVNDEQSVVDIFSTYANQGYAMFPNPRWGWQVKQENGQTKYYIPEDRYDWHEVQEDINQIESPHLKAEAQSLYNLKIALKEHVYREAFIGEYGSYNDKDIDAKPPYVNSKNYGEAVKKFEQLSDDFKVKNFNIDIFDLKVKRQDTYVIQEFDEDSEKALLEFQTLMAAINVKEALRRASKDDFKPDSRDDIPNSTNTQTKKQNKR